MKLLLSLLMLLICSCSSRAALMTYEGFNDIQLGTSVAEVEASSGLPYSIHVQGPGKEEYEYIERFELSGGLSYENHYFLTIEEGVVVKKRYEYEIPPSYDFLYSDNPNVFNNY